MFMLFMESPLFYSISYKKLSISHLWRWQITSVLFAFFVNNYIQNNEILISGFVFSLHIRGYGNFSEVTILLVSITLCELVLPLPLQIDGWLIYCTTHMSVIPTLNFYITSKILLPNNILLFWKIMEMITELIKNRFKNHFVLNKSINN